MKKHNEEMMRATYDKNASDSERLGQVMQLVSEVIETGETEVSIKRSVIAKLCTLKDENDVSIYKKAAKVSTKTGKPTVSKADIVKELAVFAGIDSDLIESFSNSTKASLLAFKAGIENKLLTNSTEVPSEEQETTA